MTGAARGQGRSHAVRLAQEGADIIAVDICQPISSSSEIPPSTPDDLAETADLIKGLDSRVVTAEVDVRDYDALKAAVDGGVEQLGRLDIICANAGIGNGGQTLDKTSEEDWRDMIDVNLSGVWKTVKAGVPHLISQGGGGSLVNISSSAGIKGTPLHTPYTAAKHGIVGMSLALANELAAQNVRVNTVHPTGVPTGMAPPSMHQLIAEKRPDLGPIFMNALPVLMTEAVDVSNAVLFLVSDEARHVTGLQFTVDAGVTIR
ncbi:3-ketoacyl-ACP reductase [Mycobacterium malmoense]|nr:3-ketoacyl-ACP reductase [Mycobacterium malmoense]